LNSIFSIYSRSKSAMAVSKEDMLDTIAGMTVMEIVESDFRDGREVRRQRRRRRGGRSGRRWPLRRSRKRPSST
jgi:hypothetical protein